MNNIHQWKEDIWFSEFMHELEYTKGFYLPKNFNEWVIKVHKIIEEIESNNWNIEKLGLVTSY